MHLWPEKLRYTDTHRERTLLSATTSDLLLRLKMRLWRDQVIQDTGKVKSNAIPNDSRNAIQVSTFL